MLESRNLRLVTFCFSLALTFIYNLSNVNCIRSDKMYVIAHMCNTKETAEWALGAGANAIEMDLQFNTNTGKPIYFQHGPPCDCTCYISPGSGNVCHFPDLCKGYTYFAELLSVVRKFPHLALIYLDSKNKRLSTSVQRLAGKEIINSVEKEIFQKGFGGKVLIGAGNSEVYISAVADAASKSQWKDRIYVSLDTSNIATSAIEFMLTLPTRNIIFAAGESACSPNGYYDEICLAGVNRDQGVLSNVIAWTVDKESSFEKYFKLGARGIITNRVPDLLSWVKRKNLQLATPLDDSLPPRSSDTLVSSGDTDCFKGSECLGESCAWGDEYPCNPDTNFNYGCKGTYCWSQCSATTVKKEWCYTVYRSNGEYMRCERHSDCMGGSYCGNSKCSSSGCSV